MTTRLTRRLFATTAGALAIGATRVALGKEEEGNANAENSDAFGKPLEQEFERDYPAPKFQVKWNNKQLNRELVYDFVIYAHSDLEMVKQLAGKEPQLVNAAMDWGNGDWETALGGASHMGRRDIALFLLGQGARVDIFCAAMLGMLETVKEMLAFEPSLIDLRGPHSTPERNKFDLHWHAQVGGQESTAVLDYLQSIKQKELAKVPWMKE